VIFDDRILAKRLRPKEVCLAENTAEESACEPKKDEHEIVNWIIIDPIFCFEEDQLSGSVGVQSFENYCSSERAEESSPEDLPGEICTYFLIT